MLTLDKFIEKNNGKFIDYDGHWGYQCTDCMREYIIECLSLSPYSTIPATNYAKNMFVNYKGKDFTKIKNTPKGVPKRGDIIFWGWSWPTTGIAGHVGIVVSANVNNFIVFNQNYPTNSPCLLRKFNYRGVLGWLSIKK